MPFTLTLPKLSPTMEEGTIARWHKKEGEQVEAGELLLELSTDKATVEYNALDGGWLRKIIVQEGGTARINQPIAIFTESKAESIEGYKPEGEAAPEQAAPEKTEPSAAAQTQAQPKTSAPAPRALTGFAPEKPLENYQFPYRTESDAQKLKASPLARKLAKEKGVDLSTVKGSGPSGRVTSKDLDLAQPAKAVTFGKRDLPTIAPGTYSEEPLTQMRKAIGQRLQDSSMYIPHYYVTMEISADELNTVREQLKAGDVKVTFNDFVVRACALALKEHPNVNSGFNQDNNTIVHYQTIDISIAVSMEEGLITPIVRHADYKNLGEISAEVKALSQKAKEGKLQPHEYKGGSFTISNLGMFGVKEFTAIINPPQGAILAVSAILDVPVVKNGHIVAGKTFNVTLSADHRLIDGVASAKFLQTVKKYLENPYLLLV
jgi:pyruvate dehydrogenase E2 component (dihydrolipoamide acetyltransferase)